jgi:hypothetical protein
MKDKRFIIFSRLFCSSPSLFLHPIAEAATSGVVIADGFIF